MKGPNDMPTGLAGFVIWVLVILVLALIVGALLNGTAAFVTFLVGLIVALLATKPWAGSGV